MNNTKNLSWLTKIKFPVLLLGAILATCFFACTDEFPYNNGVYEIIDGEEVTMPVSLSVLPIESGMSRGNKEKEYIKASDDENKIHDIWVIEYHENGVRAGKPRYYVVDQTSQGEGSGETQEISDNQDSPITKLEIPIIVPRRDGDKYTCVIIANSNDENLFSKDNSARYSHLDSLRHFDLSTHNHEHVFDPTHNKYLLMSGWTTITTSPDTWNLNIKLIRNVCKVNVRLTEFPDGLLVYKYFQWRDVPLGKAFPHGKVNYNQIISRDWKQHEDADPDEKQKREDLQSDNGIDFYLPCNVWLPDGPEPNNAARDTVIEDNTHFTIVCRSIDGWRDPEPADSIIKMYPEYHGKVPVESADQYEFCLYPSKNLEQQFKFRPNHYYELKMTIHGLPDPEENKFVNVIGYKFLEESNCYMMRRDSKELYAVPLTRINRFWGEDSNFHDESMMLDDDTEWVAEVIWQDTPERILDFVSFREFQVNPNKNYLEGKGWGKFSETETDDWGEPALDLDSARCFAFRTTGSGEGNVVIGLRKKVPGWEDIPVQDREYLWSWHIWITEYDPSPNDSYNSHLAASWGDKQQVKRVLNGEVQVFFKNLEIYKVTSDDIKKLGLPEGYPTYDDWEVPDGFQDGVYIMDRNLGATESGTLRGIAPFANVGLPSENEIKSRLPSFGLYYQYGRKDPFPFASIKYQTVYDIDGKPITAFNNPTPIHVPEQNVSGDEVDRKQSRKSRDGETEKLPENGRKDTPVTMIVGKGGSFVEAVKHPYKFYTCDHVEDYWFSKDDWALGSGPEDLEGVWCNPGWFSQGNKSLFDPCPPGWRIMDFENFKVLSGGGTNEYSSGNLYLKTGLKDLEDNILINPIYDWTVTGKFGRNIGFAIISNTDPDLYAWFPVTGKRYHDTGGASIAEGFPDHAGHSGLWLDFENALKYFTNECQFKHNNESLAAGYPIRCIRDTE